MSGDKKKRDAEERGAELLLALNLDPSQVHAVECAVDRFKNAAAVKSFCVNHGMKPTDPPRQHRDAIVARIRGEDDFEPGTIKREKVNRNVTVLAGVVKETRRAEDAPEDPAEPVERRAPVSAEVDFAKRGDLIVRKAEEEDPEDSVRMFGIVMKPEVPDSEGDVTSKAEIENANFLFMRDFGTVGFMHKKDVSDRVVIIQDVVAPVDFEFPLPDGTTKAIAEGTWYQELYSDDPEIVERVKVKKTLNGLSIGGKAEREEITEAADGGGIRLLPDLPFSEQQKRALEEHVSKRNVTKAEGDPALGRFHNLRVEEVSLVDAAANEEDFFIIKRRKEMPGEEKKNQAADPVKKDTQTADSPEQTPTDPTPPVPTETPAEPTIAEQVAAGIKEGIKDGVAQAMEQIKPAETTVQNAAKGEPAPESDVAKGMKDIGEKLDGINKRLDEQDERLKEVSNVKATAKGASVPDTTEKADDGKGEQTDSKWAGSAVHNVFGKGRKTA